MVSTAALNEAGDGSESAGLGRGFLPTVDPLTAFPTDTALSRLDEIGDSLPQRLLSETFRSEAAALSIPTCPEAAGDVGGVRQLRLYYVRIGFLASAYVNQTSQARATELPANIAVALCAVCQQLKRPPILSYDGYALYNWYRLDPAGPIALGNIDTFQNFVELYDEHWFILVHIEIEALAASLIEEIRKFPMLVQLKDAECINTSLMKMADVICKQVDVLKRIPEKMDPALYFKTFRPYIRFFENVKYLGVDLGSMNFRGETGAQSSIIPMLEAFMKIPHKPSILLEHLADMRVYMPARHRQFIEHVESQPPLRELASQQGFNAVLEAMAAFRTIHYSLAEEYINRRTDDPRGTGGTPYMAWLKQLIDETVDYKK